MGFGDNHDDNSSIFVIQKSQLKLVNDITFLVHFLTCGNPNPVKTINGMHAEVCSFHAGGTWSYEPYVKFLVTEVPI